MDRCKYVHVCVSVWCMTSFHTHAHHTKKTGGAPRGAGHGPQARARAAAAARAETAARRPQGPRHGDGAGVAVRTRRREMFDGWVGGAVGSGHTPIQTQQTLIQTHNDDQQGAPGGAGGEGRGLGRRAGRGRPAARGVCVCVCVCVCVSVCRDRDAL